MTATLVTPADMRQYLEQLPASGANAALDALLETVCERAESTVNLELGFEFGAYPGSATTKVVYGVGTPWLVLPPHQAGSVTLITATGSSTAITGWTEQEDGSLYIDDAWPYGSTGWYPARYTVTAKWGYGPATEAVKEVALELAINLYRERDKGMFSDIIGVEGGNSVAVGYRRAWTNRQKAVLDMTRRKYMGVLIV